MEILTSFSFFVATEPPTVATLKDALAAAATPTLHLDAFDQPDCSN